MEEKTSKTRLVEETPIVRSRLTKTMLAELKAPFPTNLVHSRIGTKSRDGSSAICLWYLNSRDVRKRLDTVCGMEGWKDEYEPFVVNGKLESMRCRLSIRMPFLKNGEEVWITKEDFGEPTKFTPWKGATSDSLKRAATQFGIGSYLYYVGNRYYPLNEKGQFFDKGEKAPKLPAWVVPGKEADWEAQAIETYNPEEDIDIENLDFVDAEIKTLLQTAKAKETEIIEELKKKKLTELLES